MTIIFRTALGWAGIAASGEGICGIALPRDNKREAKQELADVIARGRKRRNSNSEAKSSDASTMQAKAEANLEKAVELLHRYFAGEQVVFDLPLDIRYYTPFQQEVWRAARKIPYGETRAYGWIAKTIRTPLAARAVGQAMGTNPVPILVP